MDWRASKTKCALNVELLFAIFLAIFPAAQYFPNHTADNRQSEIQF